MFQSRNRKFILLTFTQNDKFRFHRFDGYLPRNLFSHVPKRLRLGGIGMADHHRHALIASLSHVDTERNRTQKWHMVSVCQLFTTAFTEDVVTSAGIWGNEVAHILDYAEDGYGHGFKHSQRPPHISHRYVL